VRRYLIAGVLLAHGWLAGCGGEQTPSSAGPPAQISPAPSTSLSLTALSAGPPLLQSLSAGRVRRYEILLAAGQYLQLVVQQNGVDVALRVLDPAGRLLLRVDSPNGTQGPEELFLVADKAGRHVLEIEASEGDGSYELRVEALRAATPQDRARSAAAAAYSRARLLEREADVAKAAASYREAAKLWRQARDGAREAWSLFWLGKLSVYTADRSRRREGVEALGHALVLYHRVGDRRQEGFSRYFMGLGLWKNGEIEPALRSYEQALAIWRELHVPFEEATCLNNLALVRVRQGRLHAAIDLYSRAIEIFQRLGNGSSEAATRTNLGLLYARLGEGRLAVDEYRRALASLAGRAQPPDLMRRAVALNKLGDVLVWMEGPEAALTRLREALELRRRQHDIFGQAVTLNSVGLAQVKANRPREALEAFGSALEIFRRYEDKPAQAVVLKNLGVAYERLGRLGRARESYERGLALDPRGPTEMAAVFGLARVARREDRLGDAEHRMERSLELAEDFRSQVWRPDLRASYQAIQQEQYTFLIDLLAERHRREPGKGHDARAFAVSERARARSLLDLLSAARAHPSPAELRRLDELSRRINTRHQDLLASPQGIASGELDRELAGLLERWRQANAAAQGSPPAAAASLSLREAQRLLDRNTLLLEYFLGEERSYLWAVTSSTVRFVATLPDRQQIEAAARRVHRGMTESHRQTGEAAARLAAARLSRMVLQPVADLLDRPRLAVVAHGALQAVPFAALPFPDGTDRPLIADHEIVSLPSVSVLAALRSELAGRRPAQGLVAVVADPVLGTDDERLQQVRPAVSANARPLPLPRLPYAGQEARNILSLAGSSRVLAASGFAANRELVQSGRLKGYRILHFATHGLFDDLHPELSALALSAFDPAGRPIDGQLRAYEISGLDLRADLVVLSACRTALGREVSGEGMVGLTQGFLHAGAARLLVSLWDVDDRSTEELMKRFYAGLLRQGLPPAQALRRAQISLWNEPRWHAPYHWAGFVLLGEWR
jgi:CHAT domain-containing protein/Tfp pilus assembly protein PilF